MVPSRLFQDISADSQPIPLNDILVPILVLTPSHCTISQAPEFFDWDCQQPDPIKLNYNHLKHVSGPLVVWHDHATYLHCIHKAMELQSVCQAWGMALIPIVLYNLWFVHLSQAHSFLQICVPWTFLLIFVHHLWIDFALWVLENASK